MREIKKLFDNNENWAKGKVEKDSAIFKRLSKKQNPKYLWIGCSDSRIPANEVLGLELGEIFVHRNIGNMVSHTDINCLSVLQYGIEYLNVKHVIVCGHYNCGGVLSAMQKDGRLDFIDNWIQPLRDIYFQEKEGLDIPSGPYRQSKRLVELNILYQVMNVCHTTVVKKAWRQEKKLFIHGWVYDISTGLLKDLNCRISKIDQIDTIHRKIKFY